MQNNSIVEGSNNQEWLSIKDVAANFGLTTRSMQRHIKDHKDLLGEDLKGGGIQGVGFKVSRNGLLKLGAIINTNARATNFVAVDRLQKSIVNQALENGGIVKSKKLVVTPERTKEIQMEIFALPAPTEEVLLDDSYLNLRRLVNKIFDKTKVPHSQIWSMIHTDLYYIYKVNVKAKATHKKVRPVDIIIEEGLSQKAYNCAFARFKKYL